ncbi:MAG: Lrp/AsnC ligand binding domain-containing protein [Pseudomonadota bacterium]
MQCFFVRVKAELGRAYDVAAEMADREIASEIYSTSGDYDLLAKFYVEDDVDVGRFVNDNVHVIEGVRDTNTILTFKAF